MPIQTPLRHTGTVRLETPRLILRPTAVTDAAQMFSNWASDEQVTQYVFWNPHADVAETQGILAKWAAEYARPDYYHWGIVCKETGETIGTIAVMGLAETHQSAEIGYCISRAQWNRGYMSEAVAAVVRHMLFAVGLNRVSASHDTNNPASGRVMQKCGMQFEGIRRQSRFCPRRGFYDSAYYAILKSDLEEKDADAS